MGFCVEIDGLVVGETEKELSGAHPVDDGIVEGDGDHVDGDRMWDGTLVEGSPDSGAFEGPDTYGGEVAPQSRARLDGDVRAGQAQRRVLGDDVAALALGRTAQFFGEEPENAVGVAVGRAAADVAEQAFHGVALPKGMDTAELRCSLARLKRDACPQDAVGVSVVAAFVGEGDPASAHDHLGTRRAVFRAPLRDVRDHLRALSLLTSRVSFR